MPVNVFRCLPTVWFNLFILSGCLLSASIGSSGTAIAGTESFRRSCTNIHVSKSNGRRVINAECDMGRRADGAVQISHNPTQLVVPPEGCADISNNVGELQCNGAEHPRGSWSQSCVEGRYIRGRVFQAVCAASGSTDPDVYSSVDMDSCPSFDLDNINGQLRCH